MERRFMIDVITWDIDTSSKVMSFSQIPRDSYSVRKAACWVKWVNDDIFGDDDELFVTNFKFLKAEYRHLYGTPHVFQRSFKTIKISQ